MMPETMATFISEEDVPPDKEHFHKPNCDPKSTPKLTVNSLVDASLTEDTTFCSYNLQSTDNEISLSENTFDSYLTSLTDDTAFGSYSTNLTDEAFGSYEANLATFNVNNENVGEDCLLNLENNSTKKEVFRQQDKRVDIRANLNAPEETCSSMNSKSSSFDDDAHNKTSKKLKLCKSNQTSFSDLSCLSMYYIESDEEDEILSRLNPNQLKPVDTNIGDVKAKDVKNGPIINNNESFVLKSADVDDLNSSCSYMLDTLNRHSQDLYNDNKLNDKSDLNVDAELGKYETPCLDLGRYQQEIFAPSELKENRDNCEQETVDTEKTTGNNLKICQGDDENTDFIIRSKRDEVPVRMYSNENAECFKAKENDATSYRRSTLIRDFFYKIGQEDETKRRGNDVDSTCFEGLIFDYNNAIEHLLNGQHRDEENRIPDYKDRNREIENHKDELLSKNDRERNLLYQNVAFFSGRSLFGHDKEELVKELSTKTDRKVHNVIGSNMISGDKREIVKGRNNIESYGLYENVYCLNARENRRYFSDGSEEELIQELGTETGQKYERGSHFVTSPDREEIVNANVMGRNNRGGMYLYENVSDVKKEVELRDASTETAPNLTYRLRKCISDPIYKNSTRDEGSRFEPSGYKSRNSFHKDLNEALSSLLWQPYEYQNVRSTDEEDSSSSCSDLEAPNNGKEAGNTVNNLLCAGHKLEGSARSRDVPLSSGTRLSATNSFSACCPEEACVECPDCDAIFNTADDEMTETSNATDSAVQSGESSSQAQNVRRNLSQVNIVGLPNRPHNSRNNTLTTGQFKYNANVNSANIVNLNHHQRHHSQIENSASLPISHIRSLSVPKKLENANMNQHSGEIGEQRRYPINVSNVNVNYYRAVPANVVSSVPQIQCVTSNDCVSNVNIVQAMPVGSNNYNLQGLQQCAVTTFGSSIITQHFPSGNTYNVTSTPVQVQTNPNTNTSNNNIGTTTEVTIHNIGLQNTTHNQSNNQQIQIVNRPSEVTRTFTSTEAQTDDTLGAQLIQNASEIQTQTTINQTREQRRRERRERRHNRRTSNNNNNVNNANNSNQQFLQQTSQQIQNDRLPDLLNSHLPPSYNNAVTHQNVIGNPLVNANIVNAPLVQTMVPNPIVGSPMVTFPAPVVAGQVPLVQPGPVPVQVAPPTGFRFPFQGTGFRRSRYSEDSPKSCCGLLSMKPGSLRWFIALIAFVAVCCVLVGTVLGAMRTSGRDHLTVSLLMIGVGIVLITVSGIAWKLTSHDSSTCRSMLGLGSTESVDVCARRFVPRLPPSYGRPHHPYAAMMYPEFQYRPPPPSYQASMQEYRLRLLLLDRGHTPQIQAGIQNAVSPPPTYRSHAGSLLRAPLTSRRDAQSEYSCPPSYRSQTSSTRPNNALPAPSVLHSREQSLSLSESNHESVNVVLHNTEEDIALDNITLDSLKMEPETELNPLKMLLKGGTSDLEGSKDGNLVTIVQTSDQSPVIVTVSGSSNTEDLNLQTADIQSEMQILAHL